MAKLTLAGITSLATSYVVDGKILIDQATYTIDKNSITDLVIKIGKQLMMDSDFKDHLAELDGEELPFGTTIEEYFVSLKLPDDYDPDGATNQAPKRVDLEKPFYSKELARKTIAVTIDDSKYESAMLGDAETSSLVAYITKRLFDSYTVYVYAVKRQLLAVALNNLETAQVIELAKPTDTLTGEAWAKRVKQIHTEMTNFQTEKYTKKKVVATSPSVVMYLKGANILPVIDIDVLAGAFNPARAEVPVQLKELQDFGAPTDDKIYAFLIDPRGIRLHPHRITATNNYNAEGEFTNYYLHSTHVGYISAFTNMVALKDPA